MATESGVAAVTRGQETKYMTSISTRKIILSRGDAKESAQYSYPWYNLQKLEQNANKYLADLSANAILPTKCQHDLWTNSI
jgi:hypothetical protein